LIRVSVLYAVGENNKFDMDYYLQKHMPMVRERLSAGGLVRAEIDKGLSGAVPGSPPPYAAAAHLYFNSIPEFQAAFMSSAAEIMGDVPNYTDVQPQVQISEIIE
jgi:uncharacterized protein (TIGR02118 family)